MPWAHEAAGSNPATPTMPPHSRLSPDLSSPGHDHAPRGLGQYMTPLWAAEALIERHFGDLTAGDRVLDPACGRGAFLQAVPAHVPALGVEIDPELAEEAERRSGRPVLVGDFLAIALPERPTVILGNPPFNLRLIEAFLARARRLLPDTGRCGFILPAYAAQTPRRVAAWASDWSVAAELLPRTLFPGSRLPLIFALFRKERVRTLVGFALYREAAQVDLLAPSARLVLTTGRPRRGAWHALVEWALERLGGQASVQEIYRLVEPRRPTPTAFWREKVRQTPQRHFAPLGNGVWRLSPTA